MPDGEDDDPGPGESHRDLLGADQALAQHHHTEEHVDEGVDVVAEARLDDVVVNDGPDVEQPVEADEDRAPREQKDRAGPAGTARASAQVPRSVTHAATTTNPHAVRCATTSSAGTPASIFQ